MAWMRIEDTLDEEGYYSGCPTALIEEEGDLASRRKAEDLALHRKIGGSLPTTKTSPPAEEVLRAQIESMKRWFPEASEPTASQPTASTSSTASETILRSHMEAISSMRKYMVQGEQRAGNRKGSWRPTQTAGGMTQEEIALEELDDGDLASIEVGEMADQSLPEVQEYLARIRASALPTLSASEPEGKMV